MGKPPAGMPRALKPRLISTKDSPSAAKAAEIKDRLLKRREEREERLGQEKQLLLAAGSEAAPGEEPHLAPRSPSGARALHFFQSVGYAWSTCWRLLLSYLLLGGVLAWLLAWWHVPGPPALERDTSRDVPQDAPPSSPRDAESASLGVDGEQSRRKAAAAKPVAGEAGRAGGGAPPASGKKGGGSGARRSVVASAPAITSSRPTALAGGSAGGSRPGSSGAGAMPHTAAPAASGDGRPPGWLTFDPALGVVLASELFELRARAGLTDAREAFWDPALDA